MQYVTDGECLKATEWLFGPITKRCEICHESDAVLENGIVYSNVEDYLKALENRRKKLIGKLSCSD